MSLKVVLIGAGGLVGTRIAEKLCSMKQLRVSASAPPLPLASILLFDLKITKEKLPKSIKEDGRVELAEGDLCDPKCMASVVDAGRHAAVTVIHVAAVLSGYAEKDFDLGMKVNLYGSLNVVEQIRALGKRLGKPQNYVYCSTDYVTDYYTPVNRERPCNEESFRLSPVSYGCQKACMEILISDYTRKGFIDGRVSRLSAVIGRPGWSNSISYPYTGIFTQPLEGKAYDVPLPMDVPYPCSSLSNDVECIVFLASAVDSAAIGHNRVVQIPAKSFTLKEIWAATQQVAREEHITLGKVRQVSSGKGDTTVTEINVCPHVDCSKAARLGLPMRVELTDIIRDYINRYIKTQSVTRSAL